MSENSPAVRRSRVRAVDPLAGAWERFAAGEEVVEGVRPEILLSWQRCRDDYRVDPTRERAPLCEGRPTLAPEESVVAAELGAAAMTISEDVRSLGGVVAVADGGGRILATWGDERSLERGRSQNLGPMFSWTEAATGTTGIGTALAARDAIAIRRHEHWCAAFHAWSCAAVAVRDPVGDAPVGVIDISIWNRPLPPAVVGWLRNAVAGIEERLHRRAARAYGELVDAYRTRGDAAPGVAVLDVAGRVVAADALAHAALGAVDGGFQELARSVVERARRERGWIGATELAGGTIASVEPVLSADRVVGVLVEVGADAGEPVVAQPAAPPVLQDRLVGMRGARTLLVRAARVRFVEVARGGVWLDTDEGRLRAAAPSLEQLEQRLAAQGFLRVNRHTLVNLRRVRELAPGFKGELWLVVDGSEQPIAVARRRLAGVRAALGL